MTAVAHHGRRLEPKLQSEGAELTYSGPVGLRQGEGDRVGEAREKRKGLVEVEQLREEALSPLPLVVAVIVATPVIAITIIPVSAIAIVAPAAVIS